MLLNLNQAIIACIAWGILLLIVANFIIAKTNRDEPLAVIAEHLFIAILVITASYFVGSLIKHIN